MKLRLTLLPFAGGVIFIAALLSCDKMVVENNKGPAGVPLVLENKRQENARPVVISNHGNYALFFSPEDIAAINRLAERDGSFREARNAILQDADCVAQALLGTTYTEFQSRGAFPVGGYTYASLAGGIRDLAIAYRLTDNETYLQPALKALSAYARGYQAQWTSSLGESGWLIPLAWSYDLLHDAMDPDEQETVKQLLLRSADSVIQTPRGGMNWQSRINAAVGLTGLATGEGDLFWLAVEGDGSASGQEAMGIQPDLMAHALYGFTDHLAYSFKEDGIWFEQSISYHYLTLHYLVLLAEAAYQYGIDLYGYEANGITLGDAVKASLYHAYSDGQQPVYGDADPESISPNWIAWYYGLGAARYRDPTLHWLWRQASPRLSRDSRYPRLFVLYALHQAGAITTMDVFGIGTEAFASQGYHLLGNTLLGGIGMGVLRGSGEQDGLELSFIYKPYGVIANHQQADNLGIEIVQEGHRWVPNIGKIARYGDDLHQAFAVHTLSSNTVVVDQTSQQPQGDHSDLRHTRDHGRTPSSGKLLHFAASPVFAFMQAETENSYPGVLMRRTVLRTNQYIWDDYSLHSQQQHTFDWVSRFNGMLNDLSSTLKPWSEPFGEKAGYEYIDKLHRLSGMPPWEATWESGDRRLGIQLLGPANAKTYSGDTPYKSGESISTVLVRKVAQQASFTALYYPTTLNNQTNKPHVHGRDISMHDGILMEVSTQTPEGVYSDTFIDASAAGDLKHERYQLTNGYCAIRTRDGVVIDILLVDSRSFLDDYNAIFIESHSGLANLYLHKKDVSTLILGTGISHQNEMGSISVSIAHSMLSPQTEVYALSPLGEPTRIVEAGFKDGKLTVTLEALTNYILVNTSIGDPQPIPELKRFFIR